MVPHVYLPVSIIFIVQVKVKKFPAPVAKVKVMQVNNVKIL